MGIFDKNAADEQPLPFNDPEPNPEPPAERQAENWGRHDKPDDPGYLDALDGRE